MDADPVFRIDKRRKLNHSTRRRHASDDDEGEPTSVVRKLKQPKARGAGLQVASIKVAQDVEESQIPDTPNEPVEAAPNAFQNRFIGSMGRKEVHDERLSNYVESEISKHRQQKTSEQPQPPTSTNAEPPETTATPVKPQRPEANHRITEVELTSVPTTEKPSAERGAKRGRKPRRNRNGQPFRIHQRKRQNSADAVRDSLVEQVLHENALDMYDSSESDGGSSGDMEGDRDEKVAERFQQQFMEAHVDRMQHQQGLKAKSAAAAGGGSSGPKLGGGRSARAKMNAPGQGK